VHAATPTTSLGPRRVERRPAPPLPPREIEPNPAVAEGDFAEVYVNVGRREGARAADFQRLLTERAGIDKANVRRIRVRERNAFVSVRREDLARAVEALTGATVAGKVASAEPARERGEGEAGAPPAEAPAIEAPTEAARTTVRQGASDEPLASDAVPTGRTPEA